MYYRRKVLDCIEFQEHPCPICNNTKDFQELYITDRYNLPVQTKRCNICDLVLLYPSLSDSFLQKFYTSNMYRGLYLGITGPRQGQGNDAGFRKAIANKKFIDKHVVLPQNTTVLDFGSSDGTTLLELKKDHPNWKIHGLEPGSAFAAMSQSKLDGFYSSTDDIPKNQTFDLILMSHVLEHLPHPVKTLQTLSTHLTETGYFVIEVPDFDTYGKEIRPIHIAHLFHFTKESIAKLTQKAGLIVTLVSLDNRIDERYGMRIVIRKKKSS